MMMTIVIFVILSVFALSANRTAFYSVGAAIPLDEACKSEHVTIVVTARGGHIAFLDGLLGFTGPNYMERVFAQFFAAVFQHAGDLQVRLPMPSSK